MAEALSIYDPGPVQPVAKIGEHISAWTGLQWSHYKILFEEGIPPGSQSTIDLCAVAGVTVIAAGGQITKQLIPALQMDRTEFAHFRWEPLENLEGVLWQLSGELRFTTRAITSRVDKATKLRDPWLATTTFWVLGNQLDMNLECNNPTGYAYPAARFIFWGWRYILREIIPQANVAAAVQAGDKAAVRALLGGMDSVWLPAQGRSG